MLSTLSTPEARREAEGEYKAALEANPRDERSECRLGDIAYRANDLNDASDDYTRALQLQPDDPEASLGLAKVLMSLGQPERAEALLQRALRLDPTSAMAHFRLSTIYRQTGRPEEAKRELAEYQKYKEMKEKLRAVYHDLHRDQTREDNEDANPNN
jgi:cytochrome c-type biogenesis protein CcmH/NrfG